MLILFTPEQDHPQEMEIVCALFEAGLERLHLRKPGANKEVYKAYLEALPSKYCNKVYLHQHHDLKAHFPEIKLHQRNQDLPNENFKAQTTGAHSIDEALEKLEHFEEVYLSPVFPSISKPGYESRETLSIAYLAAEKRSKIIALGGISSTTIEQAKSLGYQHFALLGTVWKAEDPLEIFRQLQMLV
ncbi:thiamine-phosphate pyrophosphorylase [Lishizhenia tianjinensis]|uniref:Thiamine-phosphate pyrophosphorylase n=1 Tax=Lishizhenia tianjinensis TaxID=477690 RepID=A0A1I7B0P4_9FLAO|nr:thiamine phosphate synthase [Lishizhenia tianjinensis]SFT80766.1 thiamine-phosphate pyrophosphorylase [Lishizhenia tianjinensis]